ncbi:MAG: sigma-70 family RNA polymerase sigma factor [Thermodesulfobacteriota bacterium]
MTYAATTHAAAIDLRLDAAEPRRAQSRDRLVCELGRRLEPLARRMVRDEDDAQDVIQDACLQALRAAATFEGRAQVSTWLHRIVINAALTRLRQRRRRREDPFEDAAGQGGDAARGVVARWARSPEDLLAQRETRSVVRATMAHLPRDYRTVLELRDIQELDTEATAARLGISRNAVKTRLHRARRALRALLEQGADAALPVA